MFYNKVDRFRYQDLISFAYLDRIAKEVRSSLIDFPWSKDLLHPNHRNKSMKKLWNTINQKLDKGDNRIYVNIFIAAMLVMCFPLFNNQLFIGHDWTYHMLRIQSLKEGLLTGQFPVRVNPLFLNGYGYASSMFYPDLLLYIPVGLQLLGIGIEESYKMFLILVLAASFLTAYYCGKGITKSSYAGIIFALVFSLSQYHLQNIYTRFAVGEVTAYIFLPFIIYGLL